MGGDPSRVEIYTYGEKIEVLLYIFGTEGVKNVDFTSADGAA